MARPTMLDHVKPKEPTDRILDSKVLVPPAPCSTRKPIEQKQLSSQRIVLFEVAKPTKGNYLVGEVFSPTGYRRLFHRKKLGKPLFYPKLQGKSVGFPRFFPGFLRLLGVLGVVAARGGWVDSCSRPCLAGRTRILGRRPRAEPAQCFGAFLGAWGWEAPGASTLFFFSMCFIGFYMVL